MAGLSRFLLAASLFTSSVMGCAAAYAQGSSSSQNDANNPLTPKITINFQDYYVPSIIGAPGRSANQFLFRGIIPMKLFGVGQLFRFTLPVATAPTFPTGTDAGLGDLTLMDIIMFPGKPVSFGVGPLLVAPTASTDALGAGKWQAGGVAVVVAPQSWGLLGGLVTYQQSFAGDKDRKNVNLLTFEPIVFYNLPQGFYLRSTGIWNFDFENKSYYIPVGLGIGKVWQLDRTTTLNAFIEPQYTAFHHGSGAPRWQIFAGLNLQFDLEALVK